MTTEKQALEDLRGLVQVSIQCSQSMIALVRMGRDIDGTNERAQSIAAAIEELVNSIKQIADTSSASSQHAQTVQETATRGCAAAHRAVSSMDHINRTVQDTAQRIDGLSAASTEIGEIIGTIDTIARQTNLLALNATIEAVRAGEAGRGFAVVASEVKELARKAKEAAETTQQRIAHLQGDMSHIVQAMRDSATAVDQGRNVIQETGREMESVQQQVDHIGRAMNDITHILQEQEQATTEVSEGVHSIATMAGDNARCMRDIMGSMDHADDVIRDRVNRSAERDIPLGILEVAKADHIDFKKKVIRALLGQASLPPQVLKDHHNCRLGLWYRGVSDEAIRNQPAFKALDGPHRRVHDHARNALEAHAVHDAEGAYRHLQGMEQASGEVLEGLEALAQQLNAIQSGSEGRKHSWQPWNR